MNDVTPIQSEVLQFIAKLIGEGLPPTHREIASHFRWSSNAAAKFHLLGLEKKGMIKTVSKISRGIGVTEQGKQYLLSLLAP